MYIRSHRVTYQVHEDPVAEIAPSTMYIHEFVYVRTNVYMHVRVRI